MRTLFSVFFLLSVCFNKFPLMENLFDLLFMFLFIMSARD